MGRVPDGSRDVGHVRLEGACDEQTSCFVPDLHCATRSPRAQRLLVDVGVGLLVQVPGMRPESRSESNRHAVPRSIEERDPFLSTQKALEAITTATEADPQKSLCLVEEIESRLFSRSPRRLHRCQNTDRIKDHPFKCQEPSELATYIMGAVHLEAGWICSKGVDNVQPSDPPSQEGLQVSWIELALPEQRIRRNASLVTSSSSVDTNQSDPSGKASKRLGIATARTSVTSLPAPTIAACKPRRTPAISPPDAYRTASACRMRRRSSDRPSSQAR